MGKKTAAVAKKAKNRIYTVTIYPKDGGPFEVDIQSESDGTITHEGKTWVIAPNSVWVSGGKHRTCAPEAAAETLNPNYLDGKTYMNARLFFLFLKMKLLEQLFKLQDDKPWFKNAGTWGIIGTLVVVCLVMIWMTVQIGNGFENLNDSLGSIDLQGSGPNTGHNTLNTGA